MAVLRIDRVGDEASLSSFKRGRFNALREDAVSALSLALTESGALILELSRRHATLEDLFFSLTEGDGATAAAAAARGNGADPARTPVETA